MVFRRCFRRPKNARKLSILLFVTFISLSGGFVNIFLHQKSIIKRVLLDTYKSEPSSLQEDLRKMRGAFIPKTDLDTNTSMDRNEVFFFNMMNTTKYFPKNQKITEEDYHVKQPLKVNLWNAPVLLENRSLCQSSGLDDIFLVSVIITAPYHRRSRDDIRATWGGQMKVMTDARYVFVLGTRESLDLSLLIKEARAEKDMLIFSFPDDYDNLSIKTMMALKWITLHCANAKYILKADDDMIFNLRALKNNIKRNVSFTGASIIGDDREGNKVYRTGGWKLPIEQYPFIQQPHYTTGPAYALTSEAVKRLVATSEYVPLVRLEDVYVTGIVRRIAGVGIVDDAAWTCFRRNTTETLSALQHGEIHGVHHIWMDRRQDIHQEIINHQEDPDRPATMVVVI